MSARARRAMAVTLGAALAALGGCSEPTRSAEPRLKPHALSFDALFVVDSARQTYWLSPGDTIAVRLTVEPDDSRRSDKGLFRYAGVPIWMSAPADSANFVTSYFTVEQLPDHLIGVFWGEQVAGTRLVLILDPERLSLQWAVTTNDQGSLIELASGTGVGRPTS
jgi:hypothetical protein